MWRKNFIVAPVLEASLILILAIAGWIGHHPLVFASLGPTAYEIIETPTRITARPYNIIVGHVIGIVAGFAALWLTHAWAVPAVSVGSGVPLLRVWAVVLAAMLTVFGTLLARANQPAAVATALLISAGIMQTWKDGATILVAILLITAIGEPIRRWRAKDAPAFARR